MSEIYRDVRRQIKLGADIASAAMLPQNTR
jgi:hypothetical protein